MSLPSGVPACVQGRCPGAVLAVVVALTIPAGTSAVLAAPLGGQDVLGLAVGDPARRDKIVALLLDGIVDTADGAVLTPDQVADRLSEVQLLLVGESHTSIEIHRAQTQILAALLRSGRRVLVGLEMFPVTEQPSLDRWIADHPGEEDFVESARWYEHWGYNWGYYRDAFLLAQSHGAPMYAINAPRPAVTAVREKGFANLDEVERAGLPPAIDVDSPEHLRLFKAYFGDGDAMHSAMSDEQWLSMFSAQVTWDATMAYHAVRAIEAHAGEDPIMVVLVGSGHVAYGLGIARQAARFFDGQVRTLIPVAVADGEGHPVTAVQASYADYLWGVPAEGAPLYPGLGVSVRESPEGGLAVLFVDDEAPGGHASIRSGDRLIALDGAPLDDREAFNRRMGAKRWGDGVRIELVRDGESLTLDVPLRRDR